MSGASLHDKAGAAHEIEMVVALLAMRRVQKAGKSLRTIATAMQERGFAISHQGVKKALTRVGEVV
jgi:hypothetical protein